MKKDDFDNAVKIWTDWASKQEDGCYDIALLKIWIKFERFIAVLFVTYALGNASEDDYTPERKLEFSSEEQLNAFLFEGNKLYVDYWQRIKDLSKFIFKDDPFTKVIFTTNNAQVCQEVTNIRNYIVHESVEAKKKLINSIFGGHQEQFVEPREYLKKKRKKIGKTNYTYYIDALKDIVLLLINPPC